MRLFGSVLDFLRTLLRRGPRSPVPAKPAAKTKPAPRAKPGAAKPAPAKKKPPAPVQVPEEYAFTVKLDPAKAKPAAKPPTPVRPAVPEAEARAAQEPGEAAPADLDLKLAEEKKEKRKAFRVSIRGLTVACAEFQTACPAVDLSALGIGFQHEGPRLKAGTVLTLTIQLSGQTLAEGLQAKVVRHEQGVVGAAFQELTRPQEDHVYKIVLEAQRGILIPQETRGEAAKGGHKPQAHAPAAKARQPETHPASGARSAPAAHAGASGPAKAAQPAPTAARTPAPPDAKAAQPGGQRVPRPAQPAPSGVRPPAQGANPTGPGPSGTRAETRTVPSAPRPARLPAQAAPAGAKPAAQGARPAQPAPQAQMSAQAGAAKASPGTPRK